MTDPSPAHLTLQTALDALNAGDPGPATSLALQILRGDPHNRDALAILGAARYISISNPHAVFFSKLKSIGYQPENVIDVGAYEGHWTKALIQAFPEARCLMIEAQPAKAPVLEEIATSFEHVSSYIGLVGATEKDSVPFHIMGLKIWKKSPVRINVCITVCGVNYF